MTLRRISYLQQQHKAGLFGPIRSAGGGLMLHKQQSRWDVCCANPRSFREKQLLEGTSERVRLSFQLN